MRPLSRTNRPDVSGWVCGKNETKSTQNFQIFEHFGKLLTNGSVKLIAKSPALVGPCPRNRPKTWDPAPTACAKTAPKTVPGAPASTKPCTNALHQRPAPVQKPRPCNRPHASAPTISQKAITQSSAKWQSRLMTSSRSRTRAKPGRCPERRLRSRRPATREDHPCSFPKKETLHQRLVQGQNGASAPYRGWHHATPQHCLGDNVVGWPLSYQGPCFQVAVTYGLPCPAVRDSRTWERRRIY